MKKFILSVILMLTAAVLISCRGTVADPQREMLPHVYTSVETALSVGEGISPAAVYPRADGGVTVLAFVIQEYGNTPLLIHVYSGGTQSTEILPTPKDSYVPYVYTMTPEDVLYYTLICGTTSVRTYADGTDAVLIPDIAALFGEENVGVSYISAKNTADFHRASCTSAGGMIY